MVLVQIASIHPCFPEPEKSNLVKRRPYQVTFSASSRFIIWLIWATPSPLNGPTILISPSSSGGIKQSY
jgi:hypothetical protein